MTRPLKKSETLEIRLPHPTKLAFMARCRDDGVSASEALRGFIEGRIEPRPVVRPRRLPLAAAGALVAAAVAAAAAPSLARTGPPGDFARLDANGDGRVTAAELARLDADHDGAVSLAEYRAGLHR
ncbi:MAG: hypothetical protein GC203_16895 [Phenylobacterium sp.]|uniref:hypothetical protein n=1 Tax=Phenylobacterium sp. TaxID=1871053 RepID=UPI0025E3A5F4|nr:hypothetical protein [Phenylobacterium sp.]MBI1199540.1 hypothetical protein [Phenylobacterium sp.]